MKYMTATQVQAVVSVTNTAYLVQVAMEN